MPMEMVDKMKLASVVREQAKEIAEVVGAARTASGRYVNDVLQIVRDRARAWVRDAYLTGYRDGLEDMIRAIGWDGDAKELEREIMEAARRRVELEREANADRS
jgi:hypothetical protein